MKRRQEYLNRIKDRQLRELLSMRNRIFPRIIKDNLGRKFITVKNTEWRNIYVKKGFVTKRRLLI